jgi:hypothetical protein
MGQLLEIKRIFAILTVMLFFSSPFLGMASADGGIFGKGGNLFYLKENTQYSVIDHTNGIQKMMISVNFDWQDTERAAWILPIPSNADSVDVDLADGAPSFRGTNLIDLAKDDLEYARYSHTFTYLASAVIPVPLSMLFFSVSGMMAGTATTGIEVSQRVEKHGLTMEIISATEGIGLYNYLVGNGLEISQGIIPQLEKKKKKDYSFAVTWITDNKILAREPGLILEFPTKDIYYPMILTSIYKERTIPIEIIIIGHVTPKIYSDIEPHTEVKYWYNGYSPQRYYGYDRNSPEIKEFTEEITSKWDRKFTSIKIEAPANTFKKDIWMEDKAPFKVSYAHNIRDGFQTRNRYVTMLLIYLFFSVVIACVLGIFIFGKKKEDIPIYFLLGIGNLIGILGLIIFTAYVNKKKKYGIEKVSLFVTLFFIIYFLSISLLFTLLMLPLS